MKFSGIVGFWVEDQEVEAGIWKPLIVDRPYYGEVLSNSRRFSSADKQNADLEITNQLSILSDLYMRQNWQSIRYVVWNGVKWSVSSIDISYPRIKLNLGGVYNENETGTS